MRARIGHPRLGALFLTIVASLAAASAVSAHAEVVTATPAQGSTVTEPVTQVVVTYSEGLDPDSRLGILDSSGNRIAVGQPDSAGSQRMAATLDPALISGTYTVRSTSIATDGHLERTQWTFTVNVPASPEPTPTGQASSEPSTAPSLTPSAPPSLAASPSPSPTPPPDTSSTSGSDAIVPIIAALAIVALGGVFLMTRGRRSGTRS